MCYEIVDVGKTFLKSCFGPARGLLDNQTALWVLCVGIQPCFTMIMQRITATLRPCQATGLQALQHRLHQDDTASKPDANLADHAHKLDHQEDLGYDTGKPATEQEKELQSGRGMGDMAGNLYDREGVRYQMKAQEQATKAPPSTGYDEESNGYIERAHEQAREAAAMVDRHDTPEDAAVKDTGT